MDREVTAGIAIGPHQWVGYWGYGPPTPLLRSLKHLLPSDPSNQWQLSTPSVETGVWATLSASGLSADGSTPFADAWVRGDNERLTLGREAFGRVPLYWLQQERVIWFASRFQLLLPLLETPTVNPAALYGYSCFSYVPTPLTPVKEIGAVPAGMEQTWRLDGEGSWSLAHTDRCQDWQESPEAIADEPTAIAQLQRHLKAAVERQIGDVGDDPVGVLLSGGLDSSIVAALLVQAGVKVRAYTLDLGEHSVPEAPYAEQVAQWLKIPLIKVKATPRQIRPALIPALHALDLPFGDGVTVPLFLLHQAASRETRLIFNGEGGDQLFAGWTNKPIIAASLYQSESLDDPAVFEQCYLRTFHRLWGYEAQVFQPEMLKAIRAVPPQTWLYPALNTSASLLHRLRRASLMLKGAQNIHPRATNLAFAHGLQVRSPFCDRTLAQWTFQLSGELCLRGACEKYILKRAVESWLPTEIVWRTKRGMGVPLTAWCLQAWWQSLGTWLNPGVLQAEGRWQPDLAARIAFGELGGLIQGRRIGESLWLLLVWQLWRSHILGEPADHHTWNHPFWFPYPIWRFMKAWH